MKYIKDYNLTLSPLENWSDKQHKIIPRIFNLYKKDKKAGINIYIHSGALPDKWTWEQTWVRKNT